MPRYPKGEIERLKVEVSLVRLVEASGVKLIKRGKDYVGCCPFHADKTPSFIISPEKNLWNCLGACGIGGDVISFMQKREGVSFRHAVELIRGAYEPETSASPVTKSTVQKLLPMKAAKEDMALLAQVMDYYHETLKVSPEAHAYLNKRGLDNREMIEHFRLGYANRTLGYRLPAKNRSAGAQIRGRLQALGIYRESGHEHFAGSLVVPVLDAHGHVKEAYGRKLLDNLRKGMPKHLYLPGTHGSPEPVSGAGNARPETNKRGVFNAEAFKASDEIILCESLIDALTFWAAGFRNVTSSFGTNGFTDEMLDAFKAHGIKRVLVAYDRDAAGDAAAAKAAETLMGEGPGTGIECFRILFPKGMDANGYACQVTPAVKSLGALIRSATWMGNSPEPASWTGKAGPEVNKTGKPEAPPQTPAPVRAKKLEEAAKGKNSAPVPSLAARSDDTTSAEPEAEETPVLQDLPEPAASPVPALPPEIEAQVAEHEITFQFSDRHWRVRGLAKNMSYEALRVNVLIRREVNGSSPEPASWTGEAGPEATQYAFHVDTFDLYNARHRAGYLRQASTELGLSETIVKGDLARVLMKLEALQEEQIRGALETEPATPEMSAGEEADALVLLRMPNLLEQLVLDAAACGIVGERGNVLALYLAGISRKLRQPLAVLIQSTSAAGKSVLMDAVLEFCPAEERVQYAAMTGQALFYLGESAVKHKVLAIAEEEGAREASYALKLLQSQGDLSIASTGKDPVTGKLVTQDYKVEGPVALMMTTTAIDLDEELKNRCLVLSVNESCDQTAAIHARQRFEETLAGLLAGEHKQAIIRRHQNAQRLLKPLRIVNPYAEHLTFMADKTRTRRDHRKYLALIRAITLLHQHQREIRSAVKGAPGSEAGTGGEVVEYIEVTLGDIAAANRLSAEVLGRTLDELPPQTRVLLQIIQDHVETACTAQKISQRDYRFTRREIREACGWGHTQLKVHLKRLEELEYLLPHLGRRGRSYIYELAWEGDGADGAPFVMGLIDPAELEGKYTYDKNKSGVEDPLAGHGRAQVGPVSGHGRGSENPDEPAETVPYTDEGTNQPGGLYAPENTPPSYPNGITVAAE